MQYLREEQDRLEFLREERRALADELERERQERRSLSRRTGVGTRSTLRGLAKG
jgi:hypothetical protein